MKFTHSLSSLLLATLLSSEPVLAQEVQPVDWLRGHVTVKSRGYAKATGSPADADNAIEAAKVVAQAELLETIRGIHVDTQTAVSDLLEERRDTTVRVQGVLRNAHVVGEPQVTEGKGFVTATVEMRVCLYANDEGCQPNSSLADALAKNPRVNKGVINRDTCSLVPNLTDNQELLRRGMLGGRELPELIAIALKGKPVSAENRDFIFGFAGSNGVICKFYTPDKVDPLIRRDRGTAELYMNSQSLSDRKNVLHLSALDAAANNVITIDRLDAYLIQLFNNNSNHSIFIGGRFAVLLAE